MSGPARALFFLTFFLTDSKSSSELDTGDGDRDRDRDRDRFGDGERGAGDGDDERGAGAGDGERDDSDCDCGDAGAFLFFAGTLADVPFFFASHMEIEEKRMSCARSMGTLPAVLNCTERVKV